jgi:hypothetical protein
MKVDEKFRSKSTIKITSNLMKTSLLCYYRFKCGAQAVCTELSYSVGIADIMAITRSGEVVEVEIKNTKADLMSEGTNKYIKHKILESGSSNQRYLSSIPNRFYFCVPSSLESTAIEYAESLNPKYGVMVFDPSKAPQEAIQIVQRSSILHKDNVTNIFLPYMLKRMSNDLCVCYKDFYWKASEFTRPSELDITMMMENNNEDINAGSFSTTEINK